MEGVHLYTLFDIRHRDISDYLDVYNAFTTKPSDTVSSVYNRMVDSLIKAGSWPKADVFQFYSTHTDDDGEARLNWKSPAGGSSLLDTGKGSFDSDIEGWAAFGNNLLVWDNSQPGSTGALKLTYVDNGNGALVNFSEASDLSTDLTVGKVYKLRIRCKDNDEGAQHVRIYDGVSFQDGQILTSTWSWDEIIFTAQHATAGRIQFDLNAGGIIWVDEWEIYEWTGAVKVESPIFTQYKGFTGLETPRSYLKVSYTPSINAVNYALNNATVLLGLETTDNDASEFGCNDASSNETRINGHDDPDGNVRVSVNAGIGNTITSIINGKGHVGGTRNNASQIKILQNTSYQTVSQNSVALPTREFFSCTANTGGVPEYMAKQIRYIWISSALTNAEHIGTVNAKETCLRSLGSGLI